VKQATFHVFERNYGAHQIEPEIWSMRDSLPIRERINWRLVALLIAILTLGLAGALYDGGEARTATSLGLGSGWTCAPKLIGTVCVKDVTNTAAKRDGATARLTNASSGTR
jgi:hypothetical protein